MTLLIKTRYIRTSKEIKEKLDIEGEIESIKPFEDKWEINTIKQVEVSIK